MTAALMFFVCSFVAYILIAVFGQLTGGSEGEFWQDVLGVFKPIPLAILLVSNLFFAAALSFGFTFTRYAIPISIAVGIIASFAYSVLFLGGVVTWLKVLGIGLVLLGMYFLK